MCGVAGYLQRSGEHLDPSVLIRMTDKISHRGPDGEGHYHNAGLGLGHRRLAVIDLSDAAHQPMLSSDSRFVISYNGEVYNFNKLRSELTSLGYNFKSKSDTEVVLKSYLEWGNHCLEKFNGMFAFAIWDSLEKKLFLARDRYGIKPLYYYLDDKTFVFASEQKSLLEHPGISRNLDHEALYEYFTFQNIFTDKTLLKNVKMLPQGHFAEISSNDFELKKSRFWDFCFQEDHSLNDPVEAEEELDRLFKQAVKRQLVTDVEIGAYLSGGIDSGAITAIAAQHYPYIKSFTCGFDLSSASGIEMAFDERVKAERMSYLFKTEHYEMVLKAGDMERILPKLSYQLEEPRVGQCYPNYYVAQLASKFVKVALSGAGGDEMFGGYPWRYYRAVVNDNFDDYAEKYYSFWQRLIPNTYLNKMFSPIWKDVSHIWTQDIFKSVFENTPSPPVSAEDYINHSMYFEAKTFLHGLLVVEDKISMAHGLETRLPFLDNDLVDFAQKLPVKHRLTNLEQVIRLNENEGGPKSRKYFMKTKEGKRLLRKAMNRYIPDEITSSAKQGFSAPDASWFKGESIEYVKEVLLSKDAQIYNFFDRKTVETIISEHLTGKQNRRLFIWSLLNFENFVRAYLK